MIHVENQGPNILNQFLHPDQGPTNVLHVKPLCHQLARGIAFIGTSIQQNAAIDHWHGRALIILAKAVVATGYVLNTVVATIESLVIFVFAALALSLHAATKGRSSLLHNATLKLTAYYINTVLVAGAQVICLHKRLFSRHHSLNAVTNHAIHGAAALIAQFVGYAFDEIAGRNPRNQQELLPALCRAIRVVIEIAPAAISDISRNAVHDFAVHIRNNQVNPNLEAFLRDNPDHAQILNRFNMDRLRHEPAYRGDLLRIFGNYLVQTGVLNHLVANAEGPDAANPINLFGVNNNEKDKNYQNQMKELIKKSFIELHDRDDLVCMLSKEHGAAATADDGRNELTTFSATIQLASYVQFKEIENEIVCPEAFGAQELHQYNHRHEMLLNAKNRLGQLAENERQILIKKLLKTGDFDINAQGLTPDRSHFIQQLYNDIGTLASPLHQGPLLTQNFVNMALLNAGQFNEAFDAMNYFQGACQEAVQEIEARAA